MEKNLVNFTKSEYLLDKEQYQKELDIPNLQPLPLKSQKLEGG